MNGWMDEWMDGWMNGRTSGWMDVWRFKDITVFATEDCIDFIYACCRKT